MPLQLSVGLSRKLGLPNYSSVGASCQVELELDTGLLAQRPDTFQQQVADAYQACSQAVQAELVRQRHPQPDRSGDLSQNRQPGPPHSQPPRPPHEEQPGRLDQEHTAGDRGQPVVNAAAPTVATAQQNDAHRLGDAGLSSAAGGFTPPDAHRPGATSAGGSGRNGQPSLATSRQQNFLQQLVAQIRGLSIPRLEEVSQQRFGQPLGQLTSAQASQLIDLLKEIRGGQLAVEDLFVSEMREGAAT